MNIFNAFSLKLIYVFSIPDAAHEGCLKIGETTCEEPDFTNLGPNSSALNAAARKRIDQYTQTAAIKYELRYTELCLYTRDGKVGTFNDKEVHDILLRSGIKRKVFDKQHKANEWFITDLATVKAAIRAAKEGRTSLDREEVTVRPEETLQLRPEQRDAIEQTKKCFRTKESMLWNAKMRFGKTVSALQLVKEMEFEKTIILTHRPVVNGGWHEDFRKIFADRGDFEYGSRDLAETLDTLLKAGEASKKIIYFCSMQDLRGSETVGGKFDKNHEVFKTRWDLIIVDEAHEGTQTELGQNVINELHKDGSKLLSLTGTAFNLLDHYEEANVFTWDYIMEQRAKAEWDKIHQGDPNPYACLPRMNILTYDLGELVKGFSDEAVAFNFREFFRTGEGGSFVHEADVRSFLDLMTKDDKDSLYPFANKTYRDIFNHTLWVLPGVKEARALSAMLKAHNVFQYFEVVNVAGNGDDEEENDEALAMVRRAIGKEPEKTHTITLTCGRLTTGVSVPEWTAVFMLSGSYSTAASSYMQTIFRVQTPATIGGRMKTECYVFDFAPDRTLKVIAETAKVSARPGKTGDDDRKQMGDFLNFCPVIGFSGSAMKPYDTNALLEQLKRVYVERVVKNGFEDTKLYNERLMKLDEMELKDFDGLKKIIGTTRAMAGTKDIDINRQGLTDEEYKELEDTQKKPKRERTPEEQARLEELKAKRKNRDAAISILRGISIRMPLLLYGAEVTDEDKQITIDNFTHLIDDRSWEEFMPRDVTKELFEKFKRYYDQDIFAAAGKRIRALARAADNAGVEERIERITEIFATFRNPDKETVLTPWRVVNMHMGDTLGGYVFYDEAYTTQQREPRRVEHEGVTQQVFTPESRILEINSKTGLYPLYVAYSIYRARLALSRRPAETMEEQLALWDKTLSENIFVVCKTPMAKSITRRTLAGFRGSRVNARYFEDLINQIKNKPRNFIEKMGKGKTYWKANQDDNMKFNAIVGNPPYQVMDGGGTGSSAVPVYQYFVGVAKQLEPKYISMIMPAKWYTGGKGLDDFRSAMLNDNHICTLVDFEDSRDCFPTVDVAGGVCYFLWDSRYDGACEIISVHGDNRVSVLRPLGENETFVRDTIALQVIKKVQSEHMLDDIVFSRKPFGFTSFFEGTKNHFEGAVELFGSKGISYVHREDVSTNYDLIDRWKLIMSKTAAEHAGQADKNGQKRVLSRIEVLKPGAICSETYLLLNTFDNEQSAINMQTYMKTRFVRFLLSTILLTQNIAKDKFRFVPLQDFTAASDIDWSRSVDEVDAQLYAKYALTGEEVAFIERMIKPMA